MATIREILKRGLDELDAQEQTLIALRIQRNELMPQGRDFFERAKRLMKVYGRPEEGLYDDGSRNLKKIVVYSTGEIPVEFSYHGSLMMGYLQLRIHPERGFPTSIPGKTDKPAIGVRIRYSGEPQQPYLFLVAHDGDMENSQGLPCSSQEVEQAQVVLSFLEKQLYNAPQVAGPSVRDFIDSTFPSE